MIVSLILYLSLAHPSHIALTLREESALPPWYRVTHQARITLKKETIRPRFLVQGSWVTLPDSDRFLAGCEPPSVVDAKKVLLLVPYPSFNSR